MSHPSHPPPYEAIYNNGVQMHPVQVQPGPRVVIVQSPHFTPDTDIRNTHSCVAVCRNCQQTVMTETKMIPALRTHACAAILFLIGFWPCCYMPYCMPSCNNIDHFCPKCQAYLGSYTG